MIKAQVLGAFHAGVGTFLIKSESDDVNHHDCLMTLM